MTKSETDAASASAAGVVRAHAPLAGIACALVWGFWINTTSGASAVDIASYGSLAEALFSGQLWQLTYVVMSVALVAWGLVARKRPDVLASRAVGGVVGALGAAASALLFFAYGEASTVALMREASLTVCGCCLAFMYVQWAPVYAGLGIRTAAGCLFASNILASCVKGVLQFVPEPVGLVVALLMPVLSIVLAWSAARPTGEAGRGDALGAQLGEDAGRPQVRFDAQNASGLWKVAAAFAVLSFVTAYLLGSLTGNQGSVLAGDFLAARLFEIVVSAVMLVVVLVLKRSFNFSQLWRVVLLTLAVDMLLQMLLPDVALFRCIESSAWDLIVLFAWLTLVDIGRHAKMHPATVVGLGFPFYTLPFAVGSLAATYQPSGTLDPAALVVMLFCLLLVATFCLELRDLDTRWIFSDLSGEKALPQVEVADVDSRCEQLAKEHGLTARELEVMQMLARGRTKAYIAETLYLSENTVRSHTKHLYTKLDVHSKRELLDVIGLD